MRRFLAHIAVGLFFLALALAWTFPLARHLSTHLPGSPGDNITFLWNFWWMRQALATPGASFLTTDRVFAPFGIDLTLHTHTALPALAGATLLAPLSTIAAQNVAIIAALALNGFTAYLLAFDRTGSRAAALAGGTIFVGSPYIAGHLLGHFNLIGAWGLPLFAMFFLRALERESSPGWWRPSVAAGLVAVAVAWTDYYYLVYCAALGLALIAWEHPFARVTRRPGALPRGLQVALATLFAIDLAIIGAILITGGFTATLGSVTISAYRVTNPLAVGWGVIAIWLLLRFRPKVVRGSFDFRVMRRLGPGLAVAAAGMWPILLNGFRLWRQGDYLSPAPSWRSGPGGIDLATLVLGNPLHPIWGAWSASAYDVLHLDRVEGVGWLGVAPGLLAVWALTRFRTDPEIRRWLVLGTIFFVWALGPWLRVAGFDTGLLLPQHAFAYIPGLANARMPGRAIVVVFLALSVIAAGVLARAQRRQRGWIAAMSLILIVVDFLPAPYPLTEVTVPRLYAQLRDRPEGTVCELPIGWRDGLARSGPFDEQLLLNQMVHQHPIVGGFAARIPPSIVERYRKTAVLRSLFALSDGQATDPQDAPLTPAQAGQALRTIGVVYIVLNRTTAPAQLIDYVETALPLTPLEREGNLTLYQVRRD